MSYFTNLEGRRLIEAMVEAIQSNARMLSEVDGATGDGDHGINMNKGFTLSSQCLEGRNWNLTEGLQVLGTVLLEEIGGAMGPLYGSCFLAMSEVSKDQQIIDAHTFGSMLRKGSEALVELGDAKRGDKTLLDTILPAIDAYESALSKSGQFATALQALSEAAEIGMESTRNMVAKKGRASRLGERSRGVLDAGAVSSCLILKAMVEGGLSSMATKV